MESREAVGQVLARGRSQLESSLHELHPVQSYAREARAFQRMLKLAGAA